MGSLRKSFVAKDTADLSTTGTEKTWSPAERILMEAVPEAKAHEERYKEAKDESSKK